MSAHLPNSPHFAPPARPFSRPLAAALCFIGIAVNCVIVGPRTYLMPLIIDNIPCRRSTAAVQRKLRDYGQFLMFREELREARVSQRVVSVVSSRRRRGRAGSHLTNAPLLASAHASQTASWSVGKSSTIPCIIPSRRDIIH
jgi:hypothetical protein